VNLFNQDRVKNIIPFDGEVDYHGLVFSKEESEQHIIIRVFLTSNSMEK